MRITRVVISEWRNLQDVDLAIDPGAPLVCLVGENGTGKSAILELLSAAAHHLGISPGVETRRGDPFRQGCDFAVDVIVPVDQTELQEQFQQSLEGRDPWTGQVRLENRPGRGIVVTALGVPEEISHGLAANAVQLLRERGETQHLYLDSERSYPTTIGVLAHQYGEILTRNWEDPAHYLDWSYRTTETLYAEWLKYLYGRHQAAATKYQAAMHQAHDSGGDEPTWLDWRKEYREMLTKVLPHLQFAGVGVPPHDQSTAVFDSSGAMLKFSDLSGGEREIAFLVLQP